MLANQANVLLVVLLLFAVNVSAQTKPPSKPTPKLSDTDVVQDMRIKWLEERIEANYAALNCNNQKFDSLLLKAPKLLVFALCKNIEPFLEGHKVTFEVGNPYSFGLGGIKGGLKYGKEWASKSAEVVYTGDLPAGRLAIDHRND